MSELSLDDLEGYRARRVSKTRQPARESLAYSCLYITKGEVARQLQVSRRTVESLIESGVLTSVKVSERIERVVVADFIDYCQELENQAKRAKQVASLAKKQIKGELNADRKYPVTVRRGQSKTKTRVTGHVFDSATGRITRPKAGDKKEI